MRQIFDHDYLGKIIHEPYYDEVLDMMNYRSIGRVEVAWKHEDGVVHFDMDNGSKAVYTALLVTEEELALLYANQPRNLRKMLK